MEKPKDKLQLLRERYEREGKNGDLSEAARRAKVSNPASSTGLARLTWDNLTPAERKCMVCLTRILNERQKEDAEMSKSLSV